MKNRVVTLVADPFPPYQYMEGSQVTGLDYEIIINSFRNQNIKASVALRPWDECIQSMDQALADGIFQIAKTPERERRFLFSDLLRIAKTLLYCNKARPVTLDESGTLAEQLRKTTIATVRGYSYGPEFDGLQGISRMPLNSHQDALLELSARNVDLAIIDQGVAVHLIDRLRLGDTLQEVANFEINRPLLVAFQKAAPQIRKIFNRGLDQVRRNGTYDVVMSKYKLNE